MSDTTRTTFTLDFLQWTPWLERATETELAPEKRERVEAPCVRVGAGHER